MRIFWVALLWSWGQAWAGAPVVATAEFAPRGEIKGDVLYLTGFGDAADNHRPLFHAWNREGLRVITFDYPGQGASGGRLNAHGLDDLAEAAWATERRYRADRPLYLAGWSTGGLLAVRMLQGERLLKWSRLPRAVVLFTPGVAVRKIIGRPSWRYPLGEVTLDTLTHETDRTGLSPIRPRSPGLVPGFAWDLLLQSGRARRESYPATLPTLVLLAGDDDRYVDTSGVRRWTLKQGAAVRGLECPRARHWLDREPAAHGGAEAVAAAVAFVAAGEGPKAGQACRVFK